MVSVPDPFWVVSSGDSGPATSAELDEPWSVAVDTTGNLLISNTFDYRIRLAAAATGTFYGQPTASNTATGSR
jgi:hypothetical protein